MSAVCNCLFNIFIATPHIGGRFSIRNMRKLHAMVTVTHLSRISQLICVIITIAVWNKSAVKNQAKQNCKQSNLLLHNWLNTFVYLKCIKKERVINFDYYKYDDFYVCIKIFLVSAYLQVGNNVPVMLIQMIYQ